MAVDPEFLMDIQGHREALAALSHSVLSQKGFIVLMGDAGTGKTTLLMTLMRSIPAARARFSMIFNSTLTSAEFLELVLLDFGLTDIPASKAQRLVRLQQLLAELHGQRKVAVLVVDEAHNLSPEVLEEIRLLSNFESADQKLLQIVLAGQTPLRDLLNRDDVRSVKLRIPLRVTLHPLLRAQVEQYIHHRWNKAGATQPAPFTPQAIQQVSYWSHGIPKLINAICDNALILAFRKRLTSITGDHIDEVSGNLDLLGSDEHFHPVTSRRRYRPRMIAGISGASKLLEIQASGGSEDHSFSPPEIVTRSSVLPISASNPVALNQDAQLNGESDFGGLLQYWRILWRRKLWIGAMGIAGAAIGFFLGAIQPNMYRSRASLEIQGRNHDFLNLKSIEPIGSDLSPMELETQVALLQSRSLRERVLRKMTQGEAAGTANVPAAPIDSVRMEALRMAASSMQATSGGRTRIVQISSESTNPAAAADFLNALANEYIDGLIEARWTSTQRTSNWLTTQLGGLKKNLEKSEREVVDYARASALIFTSESTKDTVAQQKLRQLQIALADAQADRMAKQSRLAVAKSSPPHSLSELLNDNSLRSYESTLTDLRRQLADLSSSFTPAHYKVKRVEAQIVELDAAIKTERENLLRRIQNEFDATQHQEQLLANAYADQSKVVEEQASTAVHYDMMKHDVETAKLLYDSLLAQLRQSEIGSAMQASAVRVVEPARPNPVAFQPTPPLDSVLGFATALFLGSVFFIFRERTDSRFKIPGEAAAYLSVPELGAIPAASTDPDGMRLVRERKPFFIPKQVRLRLEFRFPGRHSVNGVERERHVARIPEASISTPSERLELVTWQRKPSVLAESFRATLASMLFAREDSGRAIVITSPGPNEGKTTMTSNLGIALAEINRRVLLIDGDMRKPRLHSIFEISNSWGLSDILRETNDIQAYPGDGLARQTKVPNLWVLPSGPGVVSASNLLYSPRLMLLLERLQRAFDVILIDTPPMLALPDARILGQSASGVILVLRASQTVRDTAMSARMRLAEDNTRVIGTILNDWNPQGSSYKKYYKQHYKQYFQDQRVGVAD